MGVRLFDNVNHTHVYINGERLKVDTRSEGQLPDLNWWADGGPGDTFVALYVENPFDFPIEISWTDQSLDPEEDLNFTVMAAATSSSSVSLSAYELYWGLPSFVDTLIIPPHQTKRIFYWDGEDEITSFWISGISIFYFSPHADRRGPYPKDYCDLMDIEV